VNPCFVPLLAQQAAVSGGDPDLVLIPIAGAVCIAVLLLTVALPVWLSFRHDRWKRELEHEERMKALELGRPWPGDQPWLTLPKLALGIGAVVPVAAFACGFLAAFLTDVDGGEVWRTVLVVGMTAVICGTVLASQAFREDTDSGIGKPRISAAERDLEGIDVG